MVRGALGLMIPALGVLWGWLFLDEATSSLPEEAQDALYTLIKQKLDATTLVSIGHRASLAEHHERRLALREQALAPV